MQKKRIFVTTNGTIPLGRQGENMVRQIAFPQSLDLMAAEWSLSAQRSGDKSPYPVSLGKSGDAVVWDVTGADTAMRGLGRAQLMAVGADGEILLSRVYTTDVQASLDVEGDPPDPVKPWYAAIIERLNQGGGSAELDTTLTEAGKAADAKAVGDALDGKQPKGNYALKDDIKSAPVQSVNDKTGTVTLTAEDVGALPSSTEIPSKTSDLTNDSGYLTSYTETDPTVPAWAKRECKPSYTAEEVGADCEGTATKQVSAHNSDEAAHSDIRALVSGLTERLNGLANSDDETLDQMAEIVAYIKDNRELIEQITTDKVSASDIVDNLATNIANKPLSAAQGVALKNLIGAITVPTKVSQLANDAGYLTQHQDISGKLDADKLPIAVNTALAQARESGEFAGKDGYSPVKGVDYWTDADKQEIADSVGFDAEDALVMLAESGIITPVVDLRGKIYTISDKILVI